MWKSASGNREATGDGTSPAASKEGEASSGPGRSPLLAKKLIVLIVVGLALAGGGIGAAKFIGGRAGGDARSNHKVVAPLTYEFKDLAVNIGGTGMGRLLDCVMHVEVDTPQALEELRLRELVFRDAIITVLRSRTIEELEYPGENAIKRQVRDRLNTMITMGAVEGVYFTQFLIH